MTADIIAPLARVLLRYVGGALISAGFALNPGSLTDPDVIQIVCFVLGALASAASECWYIIAKKKGWST